MQVINGTTYLTHDEYNAITEEASIAASELGSDRELDHNSDQFEYDFVSNKLGTEDWDVTASDEPDDNYDMDRYY